MTFELLVEVLVWAVLGLMVMVIFDGICFWILVDGRMVRCFPAKT